VTLLPSDHSAARILKALFRRFAVIDSEALFLEAGFNILSKRGRSLMRVATHPMVTGYVFKVFLSTSCRAYGRNRVVGEGSSGDATKPNGFAGLLRNMRSNTSRYLTSGSFMRRIIPPAVPTTNP
jgi:hypothetical protein